MAFGISLLTILQCGDFLTSTDVLDGKFGQGGETLKLIAPAKIETGGEFEVVVTAIKASTGLVAPLFFDKIEFSIIGTGSVTLNTTPGFQNGVQTVRLVYASTTLTAGQKETIVLSVKSLERPNITGTSSAISATIQITFKEFQFMVPTSTIANQNFSVTIQAIGTDGLLFTDYTGTANLTPVTL